MITKRDSISRGSCFCEKYNEKWNQIDHYKQLKISYTVYSYTYEV